MQDFVGLLLRLRFDARLKYPDPGFATIQPNL